MLEKELVSQVKQLSEKAVASASEYSTHFEQIKAWIVSNFGDNGLIAAYIAIAAFLVFIVSRLAKITFSTVKYLILPAVAIAFIASYIVPYSFFALLPVTVTASSLFLLFRG